MLNFEVNASKIINVQKLTNMPFDENWTFHWYACRDKECIENDNSFYKVNGQFVDTNQEIWMYNSSAEYTFLESNSPNEPFYIWVAVNKNNGDDICYYFTEVRVFGSNCDYKINFEDIDCLRPGIENKQIRLTLCTSIQNLTAIRLSVSNNSVISFNRQNEKNRNSVTVDLINVSPTVDMSGILATKFGCCRDYPLCYEFQTEINTSRNGGYGRIEFVLIDENGDDIQGCIPVYEFFIQPLFTPQIECRSNMNVLLCHETDLPVCQCVNNVRFDKEKYFISSTLDLTLFFPILHKLRFVYSVGVFTNEDETICFNNTSCYQNDTLKLENYESQMGWTLKLPGCANVISSNNDLEDLNEFLVIYDIKGTDLIIESDNKTTFVANISRDEINALNEQFKQVNYLVKLKVERIESTCMELK